MKEWMLAHSFSAGDRVMYENAPATVIDVFPDGIHHVKLDETGRVVACLTNQLIGACPTGIAEPFCQPASLDLNTLADWPRQRAGQSLDPSPLVQTLTPSPNRR